MKDDKKMKNLLIGSICINLILFFTITNMKGEIQNMNNNVINLQHNVNNIGNGIDSLEYRLKEEDNFILKTEIRANEDTISKEGCQVKANISFKGLAEDEKPYIMYRPYFNTKTNIMSNSDTEWTEIELNKIATLGYEANLHIKYDYNYEYKIVIKGNVEKSSEIQILQSELYQPITMEANNYYSDNNVNRVIINVIKRYYVEGFDVENITLKIDGIDEVYTAIEKEDFKYEKELYLKGEDFLEVKQYQIEVPLKDLKTNDMYNRQSFIELKCKNDFNIIKRSMMF